MSIWFTFYCACVSSCEPLLISKLREGGITILGKTNLSEWANFRGLNISARWSPWGWPDFGAYYSHSRSDGSSSGSAVAAAPGLNVTAADEFKNLNQQMKGIVRSCELRRDITNYLETLERNPNNIHSVEDIINFTKTCQDEGNADKDIGQFLWTQDSSTWTAPNARTWLRKNCKSVAMAVLSAS